MAERAHGSRALFWGRKMSATVADQGLVSGSNFVLALMLARWVGPEEYGAYATTYAVFLIAANLYQALLLEPMSVIGVSAYAGKQRPYLGSLLLIHIGFSAISIAAAGAASGIIWFAGGNQRLAHAVLGLGVIVPCVLLLWYARTAAYLECAPGRASAASLLYCALLIAGLATAELTKTLSTLAAFLIMSFAALIAGAVLLRRNRPSLSWQAWAELGGVVRSHWGYGRWSLAGVGLQWLQHNSAYLLIGSFLGMRDAGGFAALMNLVLPVTHVFMASSRLLLPQLSALSARKGEHGTRSTVAMLSFGFAAAAALYWIALFLFSVPVFNAIYGQKFSQYASLAPLATLSVVFWAGMFPRELGLRAIQRPASVAKGFAAAAVTNVAIGVPGLWAYGLAGWFVASVFANIVCLIVVTGLFRRYTEPRPDRAPDGIPAREAA